MRQLIKTSASKAVIDVLKSGGMGVMPTDTIYGILGPAGSKKTVERIYRLKKRESGKPFIILIASVSDLAKFNIRLSWREKKFLREVWPGKISVVLPCHCKKLIYLHRGKNTLAFRMPKPVWLRSLLRKTGPLVAPSANISGKQPAKNIREAIKYFGSRVDFYVDGGTRNGSPSALIALKKNGVKIIRSGKLTQVPKMSIF